MWKKRGKSEEKRAEITRGSAPARRVILYFELKERHRLNELRAFRVSLQKVKVEQGQKV